MDERYFVHFGLMAVLLGAFSILTPQTNTSGNVIAPLSSGTFSGLALLGIAAFTIILVSQYATHERVKLKSAIKDYPALERLAELATRDQDVQRDINHLTRELGKGNLRAGVGRPRNVKGTDIYFMRGTHDGKLFYHRVGEDEFEIVAKAGKGRNEDRVINQLIRKYARKD